MIKRPFGYLFLLLLSALFVYFFVHVYSEADCLQPATCYLCHKTKGEALGHDYSEPSCLSDAVCLRCGVTGEKALGHDYLHLTPDFAVCRRCDWEEGDIRPLNQEICPVYFAYNTDLDRMVYAANEERDIAPASLTKLLTIQVALQYLDPEDRITVGEEIELLKPNSSTAHLKAGQILSVRQLAEALLLPSGNDAAYVLASASMAKKDTLLDKESAVSAFVEEMNAYARKLGCDSRFCVPDGYDTDGQASSALDLLTIARKAMEIPLVRETVSQKEVWESLDDGSVFHWLNSNNMLYEGSGPYWRYIQGIKTGFTGRAGRCIIISAEKEDVHYLIGCFGCEDLDSRTEAVNLLLTAVYG